MKEYAECECGSKETYISVAGNTCCYPCFKPLEKKEAIKKDCTRAYVSPDNDGWSVKVNGETKKYFSKYEDYASTEANKYARLLNAKL